jgi:hypothetical protein
MVGDRAQPDEEDAVGELVGHLRRHLQGKTGLAGPARAGERQQT